MTAHEPLSDALRDIEQAMPRFARWLYRTVRKELGDRVFDAGAGIGTYTELMLEDRRSVVALETDPGFVHQLRQRFEGDARVSVAGGDLGDPAGLAGFPDADSALCLNVLEHIENDLQAMKNLASRVRPGGRLVALVPAYPWLFNRMDEALGHYRRYGRAEFLAKLETAGWTVERVFRFNAFAIPGWFVAGSLLRRSKPGRDLTRLFDLLIPAFSLAERLLVRGTIGLSLVAVCRKRS